MVSFKSIYLKLIDLFFRRVIVLFIIGAVLSFFLIDQEKLKVKTLNTILPSPVDLSDFVNHPSQMSQAKIKDVLMFYKYICDITGSDTYEKPAACGIVGYAYYYLGDEKRAIEYFSMSSQNYQHFFWSNYNLGVIYYNQEHYEKAMNYFSLALDAYPYTMDFFVSTRVYNLICGYLLLKKDDFQRNLNEGAQYAQKLYMISKMFIENPDFKKQFERKKIDLHLL